MQAFRRSQEPAVDKLKWPILDEITNALYERTGLKFTRDDTSLLWFLCKQVTTIDLCTWCNTFDHLLRQLKMYLLFNIGSVLKGSISVEHI